MPWSASQMDKVGERLKKLARAGDPLSDEDRRELLDLRSSFLPAYQEVVATIRGTLGRTVSGRPEKTSDSILAKLVREGTKLSRMQDIAGCRLVVETRKEQNEVADRLIETFSGAVVRVDDRRETPSHGYRAVHVIVRVQGRLVEVQIRTTLQDIWANVVEQLAVLGGDLKHGVNPPGSGGELEFLLQTSDRIAWMEDRALGAAETVPQTWSAATRTGYYHGIFRAVLAMVGYDREDRT
jgi:putative GTP pyrophosphokinase